LDFSVDLFKFCVELPEVCQPEKSKCVDDGVKCCTENLESCSQMKICKETRNSFNNTKNNWILPLDRILGFFEIYYHGLDADGAPSVSKL
jgi:hypothetical protein